MAKYIRFPWAVNGDRQPIPDEAAGGSVSYQQGYTPDYSLPKTDPNRKSIGRQPFNQVLNDATANIKEWQEQGFPEFIADDGLGNLYSYPETAVVRFNGVYYQAVVDGTTTAPPSSEWRVFAFDTEATADSVPVRDSGGTFKIGAPTDRAHPLRLGEMGKIIGETFNLATHLNGIVEPSNAGDAKFVKLTAGLDGAGQFNEGLLINETITGSGPTIEITAEIATGPLAGNTIHLINSENRYLMPGKNSGAVANDQMQRITGQFQGGDSIGAKQIRSASGAFTATGSTGNGIQSTAITPGPFIVDFDSANSPSARTGDHTNVKHIETTYYMRIV